MKQSGSEFSADGLPPDQIASIKELERRNRDLGAERFLENLERSRGPFQLAAEERVYCGLLSPASTDRMLDAGAGVGRQAISIAPKIERLVCADISANCLEVLKATARARGVDNIDIIQSDLRDLPSSLGPFDGAYSVEVLQHIPSAQERIGAMRAMHSLLKPGGICLVGVSCWGVRSWREGARKEGWWGRGERRLYHRYFTPSELRGLMSSAGFEQVRLYGLIMWPGRVTRLLPPALSWVESACSAIPAFAGLGRYVVATGRKRA